MNRDRSTLPMIPAIGEPEDPTSWLYLDAMLLIKEGLLAPSLMTHNGAWQDSDGRGVDAWAQVVELLRELGQVGVYRKWLRTNGVIHTCPTWCQASHPSEAIYDPTGLEPIHTADVGNTDGKAAQVSIEAATGGPAEVHIELGESDLTSRQARQLAALLLDAADTTD